MISSKLLEVTAQTSVEALAAMSAVLFTAVLGVMLLIHGIGTLITTRWAAKNSRCVAAGDSIPKCENVTVYELNKYFGIKKSNVRTRIHRDVIRSEIQAKLLGQTLIQTSFDLEPSEYKRVSKNE